jgi:hypothetical protein
LTGARHPKSTMVPAQSNMTRSKARARSDGLAGPEDLAVVMGFPASVKLLALTSFRTVILRHSGAAVGTSHAKACWRFGVLVSRAMKKIDAPAPSPLLHPLCAVPVLETESV